MGETDYSAFDQRLKEVSQQLERLTIRRKGNKLYVRGMYPPRDGKGPPLRLDMPTGCNATPAGLKVATAKAKQWDSDLLWGRFEHPSPQEQQARPELVGEWVERYEAAHWEYTERTPSKEASFQSCYRHYFRQLPMDEPLTVQLLRQVTVNKSAPATRSRELYCMAYGRLAEFVSRHGGINTTDYLAFKDELKQLKQGYEPKPKLPENLPSDTQIVEIWQSIKNPAWRWVYGIMATYGLRPHEIFSLDLARFNKQTEALRVKESTKTGARLTYPCPTVWREQFQLWDARLPKIKTEGKSNEMIGKKVSQEFRELKIPHIPYDLRHAWCIRLALGGVDSAIAAKWAGHSIDVHVKTYQQAISEAQHQQVFEQMKQRESSRFSFGLEESS